MWAGLTILGCGLGCNLALEIKYAISNINYSGAGSIVIGVILIIFLVAYIVLWLKSSKLFCEYHQILVSKGPAELIFTIVYSFSGLFIAFTSFLIFSHQYITIIVISYVFLLLLFVQFKDLYLKSRDKIRVQVNLLTILFIQSAYLIDKWCHGYNYLSTSSLFMIGTMIIPLALAINLTVNLAFLVY